MLLTVAMAVLLAVMILLLPVGLDARYAAGAVSLLAYIGPLPVKLLPRRQARGQSRAADEKAGRLFQRIPAPVLGILARCGLRAAKRLRGRVRVRRLSSRFVAGGPDPYRAAMAYARAGLAMEGIGRACAGRVRDTALRADVDFDGPTVFEGGVRLSICLGALLDAAACFGFAFLREYYRYRKTEG